jgi:serine/threonine-protein kinase
VGTPGEERPRSAEDRLPGAAAAAPNLPERIGKYDVVRLLGKGAMGVVYQACDPFLERDVALKVMLPQIADDPEQKHRFEREARAVARMTHPNVVTIFDLGYHSDGSPYIAMELLKGRDLLQALRDGAPLASPRKLAIILQILEAVGHAHQAGIVHRDIKPANTFLNDDGMVKIMDFGVARFTAASMTATGIVVGTANYMSPEQVNGARVDGRADLFSVGCMLYELVLGRRPFESETLMSTLWRIVHEPPALELPAGSEWEGLLPVLRRALAKQPEERYQTAGELSAALRDFQERASSAAAAAARTVGAPLSASPTLDFKEPASLPSPELPAEPRALIDPTPLFQLMRDIQVHARSGHLHFAHGQERRSLRILRGRIVHGTSDVAGQHLGDILVRYGLLGRDELESALVVVLKERKRLGAVLGERGLLDADRLAEAVGIHIREILSDTAGRADGTFAFEELAHDALPDAQATPSFSIGESILETARRIQSPEIFGRVLGDRSRVLSLSTQPMLRAQSLALTPTEGFLLSRVDGATSAQEVFGLIPLPIEDVERSLFSLLCTGTLEYVAPAPRPQAAHDSRGRAASRRADADLGKLRDAARAVEERIAAAARLAEDARRKEILAADEGLADRNHYELLGLQRGASGADVEAGFQRMAAAYRPETPLAPALADLQDKRAAVYARLREAREILRDAGRRARYEAFLDARAMRSQIQPPAPPPPPPAHEAVSLHVETALDAPGLGQALRDAQRLLQEEKAWDAIQLLEPLVPKVEGPGRFRLQVALARAYLRNPRWVKRAEDLLQRVIQEAPEHAEAYVVLGNIYRAGEIKTRAIAMYRRALVLQPSLPEAHEGLRALEPAPPAIAEAGLMKRLFGKATG